MPLGVLVLSAVAIGLFVACGVTLSSTESKTELFKGLAVSGDLLTGSELTLVVNFAQPYASDVDVACVLLTTAKPTGTASLAPTKPPSPGVPPTPVLIPRPNPTPKNMLFQILRHTVGRNPDGGPADEVTPTLSSTSRKFRAPDAPGSYKVLCYTPADEDNQLTKSIRIEQGPPPTATP